MADTQDTPKARTLKEVLESLVPQLTDVLPPGIKPERVIRMALTAAYKNPSIAKSTPASVAFSVIQIASWGLEIGRTAHLVPFFSKKDGVYICQPMPDFKGMVQMMVQSGEVMKVDGRVAREGDLFKVILGLHEDLIHEPLPANEAQEIAAYAILTLPNGDKKFDVMWRHEIEKVRATSRSKDDGPWRTWWDQMAIKTVLKRISKQMPLSERTRDVIEADDAMYGEDEPEVAAPAAPERGRSSRLAALQAPQPDPLAGLTKEREVQPATADADPLGDDPLGD